MKRTN